MNNCKICNSELTKTEQIFRARMKSVDGNPVADRVKYKAWCAHCHIYLGKTIQGREESEWETSHVQHNELKHELSANELIELQLEIEQAAKQDDIFDTEERWNEFISMKKETDKLYSYIQGDSSSQIKGYVIKRDAFLISFFVHEIEDNVA